MKIELDIKDILEPSAIKEEIVTEIVAQFTPLLKAEITKEIATLIQQQLEQTITNQFPELLNNFF